MSFSFELSPDNALLLLASFVKSHLRASVSLVCRVRPFSVERFLFRAHLAGIPRYRTWFSRVTLAGRALDKNRLLALARSTGISMRARMRAPNGLP